jgi:hypothetical protein
MAVMVTHAMPDEDSRGLALWFWTMLLKWCLITWDPEPELREVFWFWICLSFLAMFLGISG